MLNFDRFSHQFERIFFCYNNQITYNITMQIINNLQI